MYKLKQCGGKDPKPKKEPKVKIDKSINFSSFEWRQENFPVIADYGGEPDLEGVIKEKTRELLEYLKSQPEKLMKEQDAWDTVKSTIDEIEEALASNEYEEIELAYTNATDMLSEKDGGLDKTKFVDVKFKKEKTVKKKKAAEEDDDDIDVIEGTKPKRAPQLKGPARVQHHFKKLLEERKSTMDRLFNIKNWIKKRNDELETRLTWTGLAISDKEMISIPKKIEEKKKLYDSIKKHWYEKRQPIFDKAKVKYEKLLHLEQRKAKESKVIEVSSDIKFRKKRPINLNLLDVKEIIAAPEAPKRKAPTIEAHKCATELKECRDKNAELIKQIEKIKNPKNNDGMAEYTVKELKQIAKGLKLRGYSRMLKAELYTTIQQHFKK